MKKNNLSLSTFLLIIFIFFIYARPYQFIGAIEPLKITKVSMILVLILSIFENKKNKSIFQESSYKYLTGIHLTAIALIPLSLWPGGSFNSYFSGYFKLFITFHVLITLIKDKNIFYLTVNTILTSLAIIAGAVINAYRTDNVIIDNGVRRVVGIETMASGDPNDIAIAFAMVLPIVFYALYTKKGLFKKTLYFTLLFLFSLAIIYTGSRGGYLSVVVALTVFFYNIYKKQKQKFIFIYIFFGLLIILFMPSEYKERFTSIFDKTDYNYSFENQGSGRLAIWKRGLKTIMKNPFGTGLNTYSISEGARKQEMELSGAWQVAHNSYLQIAVELGLLGLIFYLLLFKSAFQNLSSIIKHCEETNDKKNKILAIAFKSSLSAFLVASFFLSQAFYWNHYIFIAVIAAFKKCMIYQEHALKTVKD